MVEALFKCGILDTSGQVLVWMLAYGKGIQNEFESFNAVQHNSLVSCRQALQVRQRVVRCHECLALPWCMAVEQVLCFQTTGTVHGHAMRLQTLDQIM